MLGVSRFQNKVAVVAGVEHPLGADIATRLAGFGATVVAIGLDDSKLRDVASAYPTRIEPLALHAGWRDIMPLLQEAWEAQPIHLYLDLMPLARLSDGQADGQESRESFARSAGLATSLRRGMRAGRAMSVLALAAQDQKKPPKTNGYRAFLQRFSDQTPSVRMVGITLPNKRDAWSAQELLSAGDTLLMMCHPVSRGIKSGLVIDWRYELG